LSAFNLVIFAGVFSVQWGMGWAMDLLGARGADPVTAMRWAFAAYGASSLLSYGWFLAGAHRSRAT
jgi:hypothetical protein